MNSSKIYDSLISSGASLGLKELFKLRGLVLSVTLIYYLTSVAEMRLISGSSFSSPICCLDKAKNSLVLSLPPKASYSLEFKCPLASASFRMADKSKLLSS